MTEPLTDEDLTRMRTMFVVDSVWARLLDEHAAQQRKLFAIEEAATPLKAWSIGGDSPIAFELAALLHAVFVVEPADNSTRWDRRIKRLEARINTAVDVLRGHHNIPLKWAAERVVELVRSSTPPDHAECVKAMDALMKATDEA